MAKWPGAVCPETFKFHIGIVGEIIGLRNNFHLAVVRQPQLLGRVPEELPFIRTEIQPLCRSRIAIRPTVLQAVQTSNGLLQTEFDHAVGKGIVSGERQIFIRPHNAEQLAIPLPIPIHPITPITGCLHQNINTVALQKILVSCSIYVVKQSINYIPCYMNFMVCVLPIRTLLFPA
ncbi:hypothetical protein D3C73_579410 [compost metagenome]